MDLNVNPIMINNPNNFNLYQPRKTCLRLEGGNQSEGLKKAQKIEETIEENLKSILIESEFKLIKFHEKIITINNTK